MFYFFPGVPSARAEDRTDWWLEDGPRDKGKHGDDVEEEGSRFKSKYYVVVFLSTDDFYHVNKGYILTFMLMCIYIYIYIYREREREKCDHGYPSDIIYCVCVCVCVCVRHASVYVYVYARASAHQYREAAYKTDHVSTDCLFVVLLFTRCPCSLAHGLSPYTTLSRINW